VSLETAVVSPPLPSRDDNAEVMVEAAASPPPPHGNDDDGRRGSRGTRSEPPCDDRQLQLACNPLPGPRCNVGTRGICNNVICDKHAYLLPHGVVCPINDGDRTDGHADGDGIVVATDGRPHDGGTDLRIHNLPTYGIPDELHTQAESADKVAGADHRALYRGAHGPECRRQCQRWVQRDRDRGEEGGVDDPPPADYYIKGTNQINMMALKLVSGGGTIWTGTGP
jgi:hypothetical protein